MKLCERSIFATMLIYNIVCQTQCVFHGDLRDLSLLNLKDVKAQMALEHKLRSEPRETSHIETKLESGYSDTKCLGQLNDLRLALNESKLWAMKGTYNICHSILLYFNNVWMIANTF